MFSRFTDLYKTNVTKVIILRPHIIYESVELSLGVETNLFVCLSGGLQKGAAGPDVHLVLLSSKHYHKVLLQRGTRDKQKIYL